MGRTIDADTMQRLLVNGVDHPLVRARLQFAKSNQILTHYIQKMVGVERIYPSIKPTQASGRWSTSDPPVVNFPEAIRDVIIPDPGECWLEFDLHAIEAKIIAAESQDQPDLEAFRSGYDLHTMTMCGMYGFPLPPNLHSPDHPDNAGWRQLVQWKPKDRRRHLAKTARYSLQYALDERGILEAKGVEELGLTRDQMLDTGRIYLKSKPLQLAWKQQVWTDCLEKRISRTSLLGRRRKLYGGKDDIKKQGVNHRVQGTVVDMMVKILLSLLASFPLRFVLQTHDGAVLACSESDWGSVWPAVVTHVERQWTIGRESIVSTADFKKVTDQGERIPLEK